MQRESVGRRRLLRVGLGGRKYERFHREVLMDIKATDDVAFFC